MQVTSKPVQSSEATPQTAKAQSSRESFFDTLASVSSTQVQKSNTTHSDARRGSQEPANDSAHDQDRNSNSSSIQSKRNQETANKTQQAKSDSHINEQSDSKTPQSAYKAMPAKNSESTGVRKPDGAVLKKTAFTLQVASPFALQSSTVPPEPSGTILVPTTTANSDSQPATSDSTNQPVDLQFTSAALDQDSNIQGKPGVIGPIFLTDVQDPQAEQGSDAGEASDVLKAGRSAAGQVEVKLVTTGQLSDLKSTGSGDAQLPTAKEPRETAGTPTFDPASRPQTNPPVNNQHGPAVQLGDGTLTQPTIKAIQPKAPGSTFGLNTNAGDTTKAAKSDDVREDRASAHVAGVDSLQMPSGQMGSGHGTAAEIKVGDGLAFQPITVAVQTESRATAGLHTTSSQADATPYGGNGSDALAQEQLPGRELAGMSGISAARLIQTMGATEMRVGMHSSEFGDISIRTSVAQQQMQTQISVDHSELGNALSAHIPHMQAKLGSEYGLHATIEVNQSGASFSSDGDRSQHHQQSTLARPAESSEPVPVLQNDVITLRAPAVTTGEYRLDIRA